MSTPRPSDADRLLALADGTLPEAERPAVEALLSSDPAARAFHARYRGVRATVAGDDAPEVPASVLARAKAIFDPARLPAAARSDRPSWLEALDALVASLVFDSRRPVAGVRSAGLADRFHLVFETGELAVELQAEATDEGGWRLMGTCEGASEVAVCAAGTDTVLARADVDDAGVFACTVHGSPVDLHLAVGDRRLTVEHVDLD